MRVLVTALIPLILVSCGELNARRFSGPTGPAGPQGERGATGESGQNGTDGMSGSDGKDGAPGHSAVLETLDLAPGCSDGGITILLAVDSNDNGRVDSRDSHLQSKEICNGVAGTDGVDGTDGRDGVDGEQGATGERGEKGDAGVDGMDGRDGADGNDAPPTEYTPVGLIDPCGDFPGKVDEVFLRLANGLLLVNFSDNASGNNTRFSVLGQGSYQTTDGTGCKFSVDQNGVVYNEHY